MNATATDPENAETLSYLWTPDLDPLFWREGRTCVASAWYSHVPFAHWIVGAAQPRTLVELGTHNGVSYSAFCEGVLRNGLQTRCYAVDTWRGDEQAGYYGEEVYLDLRRFHGERYSAFSELLRCTFDEALPCFAEASVDLLHIDGLHTYEAVKHDFQSWQPKLSDASIVLLHDTNVRERDFGVWRLWEEVRLQYPSFEFLHGHGLGVLAVGSCVSSQVKALCSLHDSAIVNAIRQRFSLLGDLLSRRELLQIDEVAPREARILSLKAEAAACAAHIRSLEVEAARRGVAEEQMRTRAAQRTKEARTDAANAMARSANSASIIEPVAVSLGTRLTKSSVKLPKLPCCGTMRPNGQIAVVLHLHHTSLWPEFEEPIASIGAPFDLFVTANSSDVELEAKIHKAFPNAQILNFEDRGRDVLPFVVLINSGILFRYELVCKIHTERILHLADRDYWRRVLVDGILGGKDQVDRIIGSFGQDPDLGIVVPDGQIYGWDHSHWTSNLERVRSLGAKIGIEHISGGSTFPRRSIFWIRPFLLRQLGALKLNPEQFEPEPSPVEGTTGHAVGQLLGLICRDAGMRMVESGKLSNAQAAATPAKQYPRLVAFYMPQFHPIPENDAWWGTGFTDWNIVTRAVPLFRHHRQPRLPADLGFYDLRLAEIREAQAALAQRYGLSAFCYYYYWFNGERLLHRPLDDVLKSGSPNFPFMICWANEPWSRSGEDGEREVLISEMYEKGWVEAFARDIAPTLKDRRYFRVDGKPAVLIRNVMDIPDCVAAFAQLRAELREENIDEVYLIAAWLDIQHGEAPPRDPLQLGVDNYFEFPPHGLRIAQITETIQERAPDFTGQIYSYDSAVESALGNLNESSSPQRYRSVMTAWDDSARERSHSRVFNDATPGKFRRWLRQVLQHEAQIPDATERMIFINAWNQWAQGAYLEPDCEYGLAWLEAVGSALGSTMEGPRDPTSVPVRR
jgi:lipopolysaccharide biosynthesis protein